MQEYTIHGGASGKQRLEILSRTIEPGTERFLEKAKIKAGAHCLDLGCGAGNVTLAIAERTGTDGQIVGMDLDEHKIQFAVATAEIKGVKNAHFKVANAYDLQEEDTYDLVYSRFLLSHLRNPAAVLQNAWVALKTNGLLLIEDTDFSGHFSHPSSRAFDRYVSLYQSLLKKRGADANLGQKLALLLKESGFTDVKFQISQPAHIEGEGKLMAEITFEGISKALIDEGLITADDAKKIHAGLVNFRNRSDSLMSLPRIFQVSGRRP